MYRAKYITAACLYTLHFTVIDWLGAFECFISLMEFTPAWLIPQATEV
jgi:hypothetical protein